MQSEFLLALADAAVLAAGAAGALALMALKPRSATDLPEAFGVLERTIAVSLPWLPVGSTWGEALEQLKQAGVKADWAKVDSALSSYESYRFGGRPTTAEGKEEVISLAHVIQKGVVGIGAKGKGTRAG